MAPDVVSAETVYDVVVIGGGVLGCGTAFHLAKGGMRVALIERGRLCREASGANAGGMTMHDKSPRMMPYYLRAREMWLEAPKWLGRDAGARTAGGTWVAFSDDEAQRIQKNLDERVQAGCPIEVMRLNQARTVEPGLSNNVKLVTYCPLDGYGNSTLTGDVYTHALRHAGVDVKLLTEVTNVSRDGQGWTVSVRPMVDSPVGENGRSPIVVAPEGRPVRARRIVCAGGVWLRRMGGWFGLDIPVLCDTKQMVVSERMPRAIHTVMRIANQRLSIKQVANGSVLFGGGWPAEGDPTAGKLGIIPEAFVGNIRAGEYAIPALKNARLVRSWVGLEQYVADREPLVGAIPGAEGAFMIGACVAGYTISPYLTLLLAQLIMGKEPERPLFSPDRLKRLAA